MNDIEKKEAKRDRYYITAEMNSRPPQYEGFSSLNTHDAFRKPVQDTPYNTAEITN